MVSDLVDAINNQNIATNAQVTASLNDRGQLVLTGNNKTVPVTVGGLFASDVGFGDKNDSFQPTAPTPSPSSTSATPSSSSPAASSTRSSSSANPASTSTATLFNSSYALQTSGTAETLLASSGALLNVLA